MEKDTEKNTISIMAITGFILAIIAIVLSWAPIINNFAFILAILGLVFGIVGLVNTKKGKKRGKGIAIAAVILSVITFAIVIATQQMYSNVINDASKNVKESIDKSSGAATDELLKTDVSVNIGQFVATQGEFGMYITKLPVVVTNKNSAPKSYSIKIEAVDSKGTRIAEDTIIVDKLASGQSQTFNAFQYVESAKVEALKTATFKTASVSQY